MAKILIVEDNKDILYANRTMLELNGYEVFSAETLAAAESVFRENNIALIILDIMLPDGSGLDWCRELRKTGEVKILFLSALDTSRDVIAGFRAGGDDYLEKPYHMEELLLRVEALLRRKNTVAPKHEFGNIVFSNYAFAASCGGRYLQLRQKEYAVLKFLCDNAGTSFGAKEIFEVVWGVAEAEPGELQPFYNCMSSLKEKIADSNVEIVHEKGRGYAVAVKNGQ
ncbi:MAG: response regulator transcription factor [Clostridia bacterium]|nr:response regulator transcription factor [Clostridia bacterium]